MIPSLPASENSVQTAINTLWCRSSAALIEFDPMNSGLPFTFQALCAAQV